MLMSRRLCFGAKPPHWRNIGHQQHIFCINNPHSNGIKFAVIGKKLSTPLAYEGVPMRPHLMTARCPCFAVVTLDPLPIHCPAFFLPAPFHQHLLAPAAT
jgi:hypothetical protein